ncbi:hypothetical protein KBB42_03235 [Candidatus Dojkabacteria bacterium]|nr:hypothetical protein [Candidatus Dojkabacteria bacterium]
MTKNPFYNAFAAIIYIVVIVFSINLIADKEVNDGLAQFITPIMMLSLFVLSAAVMGYVFCYQPLRLYLDGKKKEAVSLFLKTVGVFSTVPIVILLLYLLGILS